MTDHSTLTHWNEATMKPELVLIHGQEIADRISAEPSHESLRSTAHLGEVEGLMGTLAAGERIERTGVMVQEHLNTGGKRLRARLALTATAALGGNREDAVGWAAAVELLHNATLIHDDIQDGDRMRRGQPTTWVRHGTAQAINAGDLLLMLPFLALSRSDTDDAVRWHLSRTLADQAARTVRGQVEELDMLPGRHMSREAYLRAVSAKTGGLFALPVEGAALIAGWSADDSAELAQEFMALGVLFQLQDDVLDLYGDKGRDAAGSDIREGKVSALVVEHLVLVPEDTDWLVDLLETPRDQTDPAAVRDAIARFASSGALDSVLHQIMDLEQTLRGSRVLRRAPLLHRVALEISQLALAPIQHLLR